MFDHIHQQNKIDLFFLYFIQASRKPDAGIFFLFNESVSIVMVNRSNSSLVFFQQSFGHKCIATAHIKDMSGGDAVLPHQVFQDLQPGQFPGMSPEMGGLNFF